MTMFQPQQSGLLSGVMRWARRAVLSMALKTNDDSAWGRVLRAIGSSAQYEYPDITLYDTQAMAYTTSPWVYVAVSKIAQAAAQLEMHVQTKQSDGLWVTTTDHEIYDLLRRPNQWMSRYELIEATFASMELSGNAFWFLNGGAGGGRPSEIMPLRPDRMRVVAGPDTNNYIVGYVYTVQGVDIPLDVAEVIHFKRWHPANDLYGFASTIPAIMSVQTDQEMAKYNRKFFSKYNGAPSGIVSMPANLSNSQFEAVKQDWLKNHADGERRTSFIRAGSISYSNTGISQREMDFLKGRSFERQVIFDVYGIPAGLMDAGATEATAQVAFTQFQELTMWPKLLSVSEKLTSDLASRYPDTRIMPEDVRRTRQIDERANIVNAGPYLTVNEVRTRYYHVTPIDEPWANLPATQRTVSDPNDRFGNAEQGNRVNPTNVTTPRALTLDTSSRVENDTSVTTTKSILTNDALEEIAQFKRYAIKRWHQPRRHDHLDNFRFGNLSPELEADVRGWVDTASDEHEVSALFVKSSQVGPTSRVDLDGAADPLSRLKGKAVQSLKSSVLHALIKTRSSVIDVLRVMQAGMNGNVSLPLALNTLGDDFWQTIDDTIYKLLEKTMRTYVEDSALEQAKMLEMSTGVEFDQSALESMTTDYAEGFVRMVTSSLSTTLRTGVTSLVKRWFANGATPINELASALSQSYLFSDSRAQVIAETEVTRIFAFGTYIGGAVIAMSAKVPVSGSAKLATDMVPAHVACFCWWTAEPVFDDDYALIAIDFVYHTSKDDRVCHVCAPRHNQRLSEMAV